MTIKPLIHALDEMNTDFLASMLDVLPVEFSVIDAEDDVLFWNKHGTRIFKRGPGVIGRNVRMCHPSDSLDKVEKVLKKLKSGERDQIDFWIDLPVGDKPRKVLIRYIAIRDSEGAYLGTLEASINLTPLQQIEGENRLGDF
ncbi:MAG: PAS domain-containing protein [Candidatus Lokiarchaeota archaeon]|nr:PAS domain-containing protein [Candidatus Lokiarchaeota archaeon]